MPPGVVPARDTCRCPTGTGPGTFGTVSAVTLALAALQAPTWTAAGGVMVLPVFGTGGKPERTLSVPGVWLCVVLLTTFYLRELFQLSPWDRGNHLPPHFPWNSCCNVVFYFIFLKMLFI